MEVLERLAYAVVGPIGVVVVGLHISCTFWTIGCQKLDWLTGMAQSVGPAIERAVHWAAL